MVCDGARRPRASLAAWRRIAASMVCDGARVLFARLAGRRSGALLWFTMVRDGHSPASPHGCASPFLWFSMVGAIPPLASPTTDGADAMGGWRHRARLPTRWNRARSRRSTAASQVRQSADIPPRRDIGAAPEGIVAPIVPREGGRSYFRRYARAIGGFDRCGIDISAAPTAGLSRMNWAPVFGPRRSSGAQDASLERRGPKSRRPVGARHSSGVSCRSSAAPLEWRAPSPLSATCDRDADRGGR